MQLCVFQPSIADNFGLIVRTAVCFGIKRIHVIMPTGFPFDVRSIKKKALDYLSDIEFVKHTTSVDFFDSLLPTQKVILLTTKVPKLYSTVSYCYDTVIMVGNESRGVTQEIIDSVYDSVTIAMSDNARSLNVAISMGIVLSHAFNNL